MTVPPALALLGGIDPEENDVISARGAAAAGTGGVRASGSIGSHGWRAESCLNAGNAIYISGCVLDCKWTGCPTVAVLCSNLVFLRSMSERGGW